VHAAVLAEVTAGLAERGLLVTDVAVSPLRGADGNREFFVRAHRRGPAIDPARLAAAAHDGEDS
jgi:predicted rRNA methylase YqxC with S4 and FtsJ domains